MNATMDAPKINHVQSIGNYHMTGKVFGKGHFARVEEATHRIIGHKVAIKIIDLTSIKEEYARRNLHREPRVMARLRHPCIAALYETMMSGPRLYVVMEAAGGGDLCAHVLSARGPARGLPEARARTLAAQLVSAVRHMHARGVVHRDLKMENIMLDSTKQYIKIVDFGLSNLWSTGGALRTPCGSLEYAAPELFVDGRRYGPEVDLWSIGVIVYGMVTGGLPFTAPDAAGGEGKSRPLLRAAIARGFSKKQRAALAFVSNECKAFIQHLLEPNVGLRMKIEEASRHRWVRRPGMRLKTHPLNNIDPKINKEIYKQISDLNGSSIMDVMAEIKSDPFGSTGGMYNIKTHLLQMQAGPGTDLLWSAMTQEARPLTPPEYKAKCEMQRPDSAPSSSKCAMTQRTPNQAYSAIKSQPFNCLNKATVNGVQTAQGAPKKESNGIVKALTQAFVQRATQPGVQKPPAMTDATKSRTLPNTKFIDRTRCGYGMKKPVYQDGGDCLDPRLPSIDEHSTELNKFSNVKATKPLPRNLCVRKLTLNESSAPVRLNSCPPGETKRTEFYRKAGDGLPSWRASGVGPNPPRLFLQNNTSSIKRASLGSIISPHSSTNSHCKSERAMPVGWYSGRPTMTKETPHLQRFRRTAPMK